MVLTFQNGVKIEPFFDLLRKRRYNGNRCFSLVKLMILRVRASKKRPKIDAKTRSKKASQENLAKIDFGLRFGSQNPPKIDPKFKKIASEALSKTSRKKQAPEITDQTREPSEGKPFGTPPDHPTTFPMTSTS